MTDTIETDDAAPLGMVDHLPGSGFAPNPEELAFARAYIDDGEMSPEILARLLDPQRAAERERHADAQRKRDWADLGRYREANAALAAGSTDVVFIGDSITELWTLAQPDLFSAGVVNRGISGQTSPQILLRFMADVVALKPRAAHLMCGVNDIAGNTGPTTPRDYLNNIVAMVDIAQAHGIVPILATVTPITHLMWAPTIRNHRAQVGRLNAELAGLAHERGLVHADYHGVLAAEDDALRADFSRDGVHMILRGYEAMRPVAQKAMDEALGRAS